MASARLGVAAAAVVLLVAVGVLAHRRAAPLQAATDVPRGLDVDVYGCSAIATGPVCELAPATELHLWVPGLDIGDIHVTADARELPVTFTSWPDGRTVRTVVPDGARELRVSATGGSGPAAWTLRLAPRHVPPAAVDSARALRKAGNVEQAAAVLASVADDAGDSGDLLSLRARIEMQQGHVDDAVADFRAAIARQQAAGQLSQAALDAFALAFMLLERSRVAEARALVEQAAHLSPGYAEGLASVTYYEGLLAWHTGDLRTALRRTHEADARFSRLGSTVMRVETRISLGRQLQDLGRYDESIAVFRVLLEERDLTPCEPADLLTNVGWSALLQGDAAPASQTAMDAREPLGQALVQLRASCQDPNRIANVLENIALGELQHGRLDQARGALAEARSVERDPETPAVLFWHHLAGRIALARGAPGEAAAEFSREAELAAALGSSDDRRSAAEGQAAALTALGRRTDALAALDAADALLDASSESIPLGEGRDAFFGTRDRAAARRVDLLLQMRRPQDAMAAARGWRARLLEGLRVTTALERLDPGTRDRWEDAIGRYRAVRDAMDADTAHDWELPADHLAAARVHRQESAARARGLLDEALSLLPRPRATAPTPAPLAPGELELLYLPAPSGWLAFARTADTVSAARLDRIDPTASPAALARVMLGSFDAEIARATKLRLLPYGEARTVDVHALPWHDRPLLEHAVVTYALGLEDAPPPFAARRALVVADPGGDLPAARAEADAVAAALGGPGAWSIRSLRGAAAQAERLRAEVASVDLLHYAGHATFGGVDGVDSALSLAGGSRLTPGDILALPRVPGLVVLFGCDTAHESATGAVDALGLTSAFLVAGARIVVAASRQVDDGLARDVATEFYARLAGKGPLDPAEALRQAVLAVRDRAPGADWAALRVLVP